MSDVTRILSQIESGDPSAAEQLLPLVYDELRKLAAAKLAQEKPGQTLQATALVHDAYLRLVDNEKLLQWNSRGHFFGAAAEAMRRILVEQARHKSRVRHGGGLQRVELSDPPADDDADQELLALDAALPQLAAEDPLASEDEWYKAAFHQPASAGGDSDNYWLYPTQSNSVPTTAQANFNNVIGNTTPVGSYAANYYGTFDMGGNVWEWNEAINADIRRGVRGGSFTPVDGNFDLQAGGRFFLGNAGAELNSVGFRVSQVPEPSSVALLAMIGGLAVVWRRRSP